jgi:hypothetical protein
LQCLASIVRKRSTWGLASLAVAASVGCLNEYHPEYSPRVSYSFRQNISYPTTVVENVVTAPNLLRRSSRAVALPPSRPAAPVTAETGRLEPSRPEPPIPSETRRDTESRSRLVDETSLPRSGERGRQGTRGEAGDLEATRQKCRAGDAESCGALPGVHLNGNVRLFGNVVIFGDVFMNDGVASSEVTSER